MAKPSLAASPQGLQVAKQALFKAGWTQKDLQSQVGCSRQPITNFFKGSAIAQVIFIDICDRLGLDWHEIADLPDAAEPEVSRPTHLTADKNLDALVQELRHKAAHSIQERCGTMRVLEMSHPIGVEDIYINVNILEQITGRRRRQIDELLQEYNLSDFDRLGLGQVTQERVDGLVAVQKYRKLVILGKPGAGKTTFLKHLAIQCQFGTFTTQSLPIFVTLKDFAEAAEQPSLLDYICEKDIGSYGVMSHSAEESQRIVALQQVISQGRALVLLDGLDEVKEEDHERILKEIRDFSDQFSDNHFVITCRIAAWEYTFEKFTEVEIADFDPQQIADFASKWFKDKPISDTSFVRSLKQNSRIHQLAVSPLLLTLLCLAFEESGDFPNSRSELYKEGIDALLKKWDAKRGIQRDQVYRGLSHQRKMDLLSYIALTTFKHKNYFFKQQVVEQLITEYIRKLPNANSDPEILQLDSEVILRSIEAQHGLLVERAKGIYSFSHLTFHEYFAARELVFNSHDREAVLQELVNRITDKRWREVFLLVTEMLHDSALLILPMQQRIDQLMTAEQTLQKFLAHVRDCAAAPELALCKPAAVRAFFFDVDFDIDKNRSVALLLDQSTNLLICASFLTRMLKSTSFSEAIAIAQTFDIQKTDPDEKITAAASADQVMMIAIQIALDSERLGSSERQILQTLTQGLPDSEDDQEMIEQVADAARDVAKSRHHIGREWSFSDREKEVLKRHYYANQLLVECLSSEGCMMEPELRQSIEESLLLPKASRKNSPEEFP
jgi:predicted NACHT family NTPase